MRQLRAFSVVLGLVGSFCCATAQAPDMFRDVSNDEPLYKVGSRLSRAGFLFPPFARSISKQTWTRYEYAVFLDRTLIYLRAEESGKGKGGTENARVLGPKPANEEQIKDLAGMWRELRKEMTSYYSPKERKELGAWLSRELQRAELRTATGDTRGVVLHDLDPTHWAFEAVMSLKKKGIIAGYPDGRFRGARAMTREEFAAALNVVMSYRGYRRGSSRASSESELIAAKCSSAEQPPDSVPVEPLDATPPAISAEPMPSFIQAPDMFKDVPRGHWLYLAAEQLADSGLLWGYPSGYFNGKRVLTRYEFAVALDRALQVVHVTGVDRHLEREPASFDERVFALRTHEIELLFKMMTELRDEMRSMGTGSADIESARIWLLQAWGRAEKTYRNPAIPPPLRSVIRREPAKYEATQLDSSHTGLVDFRRSSAGPSMISSHFPPARLSPLFDSDRRSGWTGTRLELRP